MSLVVTNRESNPIRNFLLGIPILAKLSKTIPLVALGSRIAIGAVIESRFSTLMSFIPSSTVFRPNCETLDDENPTISLEKMNLPGLSDCIEVNGATIAWLIAGMTVWLFVDSSSSSSICFSKEGTSP